jgi:uncharacterized protein
MMLCRAFGAHYSVSVFPGLAAGPTILRPFGPQCRQIDFYSGVSYAAENFVAVVLQDRGEARFLRACYTPLLQGDHLPLKAEERIRPKKKPFHSDINLTKTEARRFILAHQHLWPPRSLKGEEGALSFLGRVRCIQYDPLNIVGHNHQLVMQSRVSAFTPSMLDKLLYEKRALVEGWDKQMSLYPLEDWPCFQRRRAASRHMRIKDGGGAERILSDVFAEIRTRGPLSSIDLEHNEKVPWPWGPARVSRAALESLFWRGDLVIHHRVHTRRFYDLAERHIPREILSEPDPHASAEAYHDWHILRRLRGIGLLWARSGEAWLEIIGAKTAERQRSLTRLHESGKVFTVKVEGLDLPLYMAAEDKPLLDRVGEARSPLPQAAIIAPLDNLLWDRSLVRALFGFDYVWEVYKPVPERRFGYYVLPILCGDRFIARFEPGWTEDGALLVKNWWWEQDVKLTPAMRQAVIRCFRAFLRYLKAHALRVDSAVARRADIRWLKEIV